MIDEPPASGGADRAHRPTRVLAASLAACTAITLGDVRGPQGVARWETLGSRSGWSSADRVPELSSTVTLRLPKELSPEQQRADRVIAGKCPVHRALDG